ncbi:MAG: glycogen/starch synthase [Solobacterium sp.]|nr:glycogen/starch synthase [Solobacterium sp.]
MAKKKSGIASKAAQKVADKKAQEKAQLSAEVVKHVVEEPKVEVVEVKKKQNVKAGLESAGLESGHEPAPKKKETKVVEKEVKTTDKKETKKTTPKKRTKIEGEIVKTEEPKEVKNTKATRAKKEPATPKKSKIKKIEKKTEDTVNVVDVDVAELLKKEVLELNGAVESVKEEKPKTKTTSKKKKVIESGLESKPKKRTKIDGEIVKTKEPKEVKSTKATRAKKEPAAPKKSIIKKVEAKEEVKVEIKAEPVVEVKGPETGLESVEDKVQKMMNDYYQSDFFKKRRSIAFIGSECYPFVKTGGLGDVMHALAKELSKKNCDVKVILPRYACIDQKWQEKMVYKGSFYMDLTSDGGQYYVGIMEYVNDGVVYDFIDNQEFFTSGNPYTSIIGDIPKYCYFAKAALAALNYMNWIPNVIHCHDWQAGLVPVFLRDTFRDSPVSSAKTVFTIHNLRFQGIFNIDTFRYWTNLSYEVLSNDAIRSGRDDVNMLKAGISYSDAVTTVSETYAGEIQTAQYGEQLDGHLRYYSYKLRGIVNGIDCDIWNPATDKLLPYNYDVSNAIEQKRLNKLALQEELGLVKDENKMVIGLISRLTDQKGLDLINMIVGDLIDGNTEVVVLGTGDPYYEGSFRYYEEIYKGYFCANIMYDEGRAHKIYAGCDCLLVPSAFEPCGLTQLIGMHYGAIPIVRETGGLKDTVEPYNEFENRGNGFTFDRYDAGLLLDAINRAKTCYFTQRNNFNEMVIRDMNKDVSWSTSADKYKALYLELTNWD